VSLASTKPHRSYSHPLPLSLHGHLQSLTPSNTVLIAMRLMGTTEKSPVYAAVSLLGFVVAGLVFGQLGGVFGSSVRTQMLARADHCRA
jgi:hypothetical protein